MKNNQTIRLLIKKLKKLDYSLIANAYIITFLSLIFVFSATGSRTNSFIYKEIMWLGVGTSVFLVFSIIDYRVFAKYSKVIYAVNIILLILVYILGREALGATRWIQIGPLSFQPSELAKIFMILTFSELLVNRFKEGVRGWLGIVKTGLHFIIPFLLIMKQPDLGTSLVLIFIYYMLVFMHGVDHIPYFGMIIINVLLTPVAYLFLKDYQKARLTVFLNPEHDLLGGGWNIVQSMIAVGSGGIFGKGLFNGTQNKLKFLPESHTDFIFSVLSEETGFIGGAFLIALYFALIYQIMMVGRRAEDRYGQLIAFGIAGIIFFHTFINMGMVIGIMPVTGIPLLLMSYGGTSWIFMFMMLGIVESIKTYSNS